MSKHSLTKKEKLAKKRYRMTGGVTYFDPIEIENLDSEVLGSVEVKEIIYSKTKPRIVNYARSEDGENRYTVAIKEDRFFVIQCVMSRIVSQYAILKYQWGKVSIENISIPESYLEQFYDKDTVGLLMAGSRLCKLLQNVEFDLIVRQGFTRWNLKDLSEEYMANNKMIS